MLEASYRTISVLGQMLAEVGLHAGGSISAMPRWRGSLILTRQVSLINWSGSLASKYLVILTSLSKFALPSIALGVIRIYWRPTEFRAAEICGLSTKDTAMDVISDYVPTYWC